MDAEPEALAIARGKAAQAGVAIRLERGFAQELPFADATFQRVVSSLFFHHLDREAKRFLTVFGALSLYSGRRPA